MSSPEGPSERTPTDKSVQRVFISYSSYDRYRALDLARAIESTGWSVWMDRWSLLAGTRYEPEIESSLRASKCVVVLWSAHASQSKWVPAECELADRLDTLVVLKTDATESPWKDRHFLDFSGWSAADLGHESFRKLLAAIAHKFGDSPVPKPDVRRLRAHYRRQAMEASRVAIAVLLLAGIFTWCAFTLDVPRAGVTLVAALSAVAVWLPLWQRLLAVVHRLREFAVSTTALAVATVVLVVLSCVGPIVVLREDGPLPPLRFRINGADDAAALQAGELSRASPRWHGLLFAPPWGRGITVSVDGYRPLALQAGAFRDSQVRIPQMLHPDPVLIVRVNPDDLAATSGATLRIERDGQILAEWPSTQGFGGVLIANAGRDLAANRAGWRASLLARSPAMRAERIDWIVAQWCAAPRTPWRDAPALDATLRISLVWGGASRPLQKTFTLQGPVTDVELSRD